MPYPLNAAPVNRVRPTSVIRTRADGDVGRAIKSWSRAWLPDSLHMFTFFNMQVSYIQVHGTATPAQPTLPSTGGGAPVPTSGQIWPRGQG